MTRALARINRDEIVRMVKAVQQCGLPVGEVVFDGVRVHVIVGDSGEKLPAAIDAPVAPENFDDLEDYLAWKERECASGR